MISSILSKEIAVAEIFGDTVETSLLEVEERALGPVVEKRRREFARGRTCAHKALNELGISDTPILIGSNREPLWPQNIVGSITHCSGYYAAAIAYKDQFCGIGIDAEPDESLPDGVINIVTCEVERTWIASRKGDGINWDRVLFSAKESVYKAWFPITRIWLGFDEVIVTFEPRVGGFRADVGIPIEITRGRSVEVFEGRFLIDRGFIFTAIGVPQ